MLTNVNNSQYTFRERVSKCQKCRASRYIVDSTSRCRMSNSQVDHSAEEVDEGPTDSIFIVFPRATACSNSCLLREWRTTSTRTTTLMNQSYRTCQKGALNHRQQVDQGLSRARRQEGQTYRDTSICGCDRPMHRVNPPRKGGSAPGFICSASKDPIRTYVVQLKTRRGLPEDFPELYIIWKVPIKSEWKSNSRVLRKTGDEIIEVPKAHYCT